MTHTGRPTLAVFGSANLCGSTAYRQQITGLGRLLAALDIHLLVGSTTGLLDCLLDGVAQAQGSIPVSLVAYGDRRYMSVDKVDELIHKDCYFSRLNTLCDADGFVVLDGQLGTMAETMVCWNRLQAARDYRRKLVVFGEQEQRKLAFLQQQFTFSRPEYRQMVCFADSPESVVTQLAPMLGSAKSLLCAGSP